MARECVDLYVRLYGRGRLHRHGHRLAMENTNDPRGVTLLGKQSRFAQVARAQPHRSSDRAIATSPGPMAASAMPEEQHLTRGQLMRRHRYWLRNRPIRWQVPNRVRRWHYGPA